MDESAAYELVGELIGYLLVPAAVVWLIVRHNRKVAARKEDELQAEQDGSGVAPQ